MYFARSHAEIALSAKSRPATREVLRRVLHFTIFFACTQTTFTEPDIVSTATMIRAEARFDTKRARLEHKKKQFATATYKEQTYPYRLSFYDVPPTAEISLEEFETWAIDRLRSKSCQCSLRITC